VKLSTAAREIVTIIRRHNLTYNTLHKATSLASKHCSLKPPSSKSRTLPKLLTADEIKRFYATIDSASSLRDQIMLRLIFYTAIRVAELCAIKVSDVDITAGRIYIDQGKGSKDRYVVFPAKFGLTLKSYIQWLNDRQQYKSEYLFPSRQRDRISERQVQLLVSRYALAAKIGTRVHPHLFRHQMLTHLTKSGMSDSQIQLISGHASKTTLEKYQHLALTDVKGDYEEALKEIEI